MRKSISSQSRPADIYNIFFSVLFTSRKYCITIIYTTLFCFISKSNRMRLHTSGIFLNKHNNFFPPIDDTLVAKRNINLNVHFVLETSKIQNNLLFRIIIRSVSNIWSFSILLSKIVIIFFLSFLCNNRLLDRMRVCFHCKTLYIYSCKLSNIVLESIASIN